MSTITKQITTESSTTPKIAIGILAGILVFGMFVVGYDQGQLVQAISAPFGIHPNHAQLMLLYEFNHDETRCRISMPLG